MPWKDSFSEKYTTLKTYKNQFLNLVTETYHSPAAQSVTDFVVDTTMQLVTALDFLYNSPVVRKKIYDAVEQGWLGLKSSLRWVTLYHTVKNSPELRKVVTNSFVANIILYAGPVILYEGYIKPGMRALVPDLENSTTENTYNYPVMALFGAFCAGALIKNLSYSTCITYHTSKIAPKENFPPCAHGSVEHVKADARSLVYYPRNLLTAYFASLFGTIPFKMVAALAYGQCIVESKDSLRGMCTEDRAKQFRRNNAYNFMYGASFMVTTEVLTRFLTMVAWWSTGSFFIRDAAMSFVFPLFIMLSLLQDKPLPGTEEGIDFFEFNRYEVTTRLSRAFNWTVPALMDDNKRAVIREYAAAIAHFPPIKLFGKIAVCYVGIGLFPLDKLYENPKIFFSHRLLTPETLLQIPELHALVQIHSDGIKKGVEIINYARSASWLGAFIPGFIVSPHITGGMNVLASLDERFVSRIRDLPEIAERITQQDRPEVRLLEDKSVEKIAPKFDDWCKPPLKRSQSAAAILKSLPKKKARDNGWVLIEKTKPESKPKTLQRSLSLSALNRSRLFTTTNHDDSFVKVERPLEKRTRRIKRA